MPVDAVEFVDAGLFFSSGRPNSVDDDEEAEFNGRSRPTAFSESTNQTMFSLRTRCLSTCVVAVLALCSVVQAQKTQTFAGKRRVEAPAAAPAGEAVTPRLSTQSPFRLGDPETVVCYGIVGAINAPDVYAPGTESFTLKQLIEMAAGTTADASAEIRIFRSGRPLSVSLNSAEKENLSHGDVVLIPTAMNAMREIGGPPVATVACLGLAQRPVIIPLAGHQPALATLVEVLQQDHIYDW